NVRAIEGSACTVDMFGHVARLRCAVGQAPGAAQACVRTPDLRIVPRGSAGVRVHVERAIYQGGHFRLETRVAAAPEVRLHLSVPEPFTPAPDHAIDIDVTDGWVIPGAAKP